jgi:hypothetical protein
LLWEIFLATADGSLQSLELEAADQPVEVLVLLEHPGRDAPALRQAIELVDEGDPGQLTRVA